MKQKRGQISFEYVSIVTFGMLVLVLAIYVFYSYSLNSNDSFIVSRVEDLGSILAEDSQTLYYSTGKGSSVVAEFNLPENIKEIYFINATGESEIVITYNLARGATETVFFVPMQIRGTYQDIFNHDRTTLFSDPGDFHTGKLRIKLTNVEGGISLEEAN